MRIGRVIPTSVWALGLVSLFMDMSSDMIRSLLPVFMVSVLGASVSAVGLIEGIAEATALITKMFSGVLSDYLGRRKLLTVLGYSLSALTKPLFPLSSSLKLAGAALFGDRIGKGLRDAPRDALLSALAPEQIRGACFGLRQALDTVGAFLGPLIAMLGLFIFAGTIRSVLWLATIPAIISVLLLIFFVKEPKKAPDQTVLPSFKFRAITQVNRQYWWVVAIAGVVSLARFSQAFLILKARTIGVPLYFLPLVIIVMNSAYASGAYPIGKLSDRVPRKYVLALGLVFLIGADLLLGFANNWWVFTGGILLTGLHLAFTEGLFGSMVADLTPLEIRGTAYGIFNLVSGFAALGASVTAGLLWDIYGSSVPFFTSAGLLGLALGALIVFHSVHHKQKHA